MRKAAIKRMEDGNLMFNNGPTQLEEKVVTYLKTLGITNIKQSDREILTGLEVDIYLPDYNLGIEINGNRFHSDLFKKKNYHLKKTEECARKGIRLIHIWECDLIKKESIVLSNLKLVSTLLTAAAK
jgi:very-short-patch-repair endonuclease